MCIIGSNPIFTLYTYDERPRETVGTRYDLEKGVPRFGLGVFSIGLNRRRIKMAHCAIFSSRFVTDNHLIRHTLCAVLTVHRFK